MHGELKHPPPDRGGPSVQHDGVGPETGANDLVHQRGVPLPEGKSSKG